MRFLRSLTVVNFVNIIICLLFFVNSSRFGHDCADFVLLLNALQKENKKS